MEGKQIFPVFERGGILPIMIGQAEVDATGAITFKLGRGRKVVDYEVIFFEDGNISHYEVVFDSALTQRPAAGKSA